MSDQAPGLPAPETPAPLPTLPPLRAGVDAALCVEVTTKAGVVLHILPATATPAEILAGRVSPYFLHAQRVRDSWARVELNRGTAQGEDFALLVRLALFASYECTLAEMDGMLSSEDTDAVVRICAAAVGRGASPASRERRRALALYVAGLGDASLTPADVALFADWAANNRQAPVGW